MKVAYFRNILFASALASVMGITACSQLLELDTYTKANTSSGGSGGMGGEAGQGGGSNECTPNTTAPCYDGVANTQDVGLCKSGLKTCGADGTYGPCEGQVLPAIENCALFQDEDCNGASADCTGIADWSKAYGNVANLQFGSYARGLSDGSVVIVGEFADVVDFGCKTLSGTVGSTDIFLLKLDPSGNCIFVDKFGVAQTNDYAYGMTVDANDNILVTGGFTATGINFGGGAFVHSGSNDIYLAKFDKDCKHIWSKRFGDMGDQLTHAVNVDAQGNIYISGDFNGNIDFGNGITVATSDSEKKGFLAKLTPAGQPVYADSFGVSGMLGEDVIDTIVVADKSGNVTVLGRFAGTFTSSAGTLSTQAGNYDMFLLRYDNTGKPLTAQRFGGNGDDYNYHLAVDSQGNVYIAGRTSGMEFDGSSFGLPKSPISGMGDIVLMKLLANGQMDKVNLYGDASDQAATGLAVDPVDHVILGGNFQGQVNFGNGSLGMAMKSTMFLAKFDADLKALWTRTLYSSVAEYTVRIGTDPQANILLTGYFYGSLQIKANEPLTNAGNSDIFVAKLAP